MGKLLTEFLVCHRPRIYSITLSVVRPKELVSLGPLLNAEMPNLESLSIEQHGGPEFRTHVRRIQRSPILKGVSLQPCLHTLQVPGCHFPTKSTSLSVRHLTLTCCLWSACEVCHGSLNDLIDGLGHFPYLQTLTVDSSIPPSGNGNSSRVLLEALEKLTVYDDALSIADLLAQLDIPSDTMLDLRIPDDDIHISFAAVPAEVRSTLLAVCGAESVHVRIRGNLPACELRTRIGGALRLRVVSSDLRFTLDDLLCHLHAMFAPVTTLTTLFIDIWLDRRHGHPITYSQTICELWSISPGLSTLGILGLHRGQQVLLTFMTSAHGRQALRSLKHLYLTWDPQYDNELPPYNPAACEVRRNSGLLRLRHSCQNSGQCRDPGSRSDAGGTCVEGALPYDPQACEAFCDQMTGILAIDPDAGMLESLHVLMIVEHHQPTNGVFWDIDSVQEHMSRRLGHMVHVDVSWYIPEEDLESTLFGE